MSFAWRGAALAGAAWLAGAVGLGLAAPAPAGAQPPAGFDHLRSGFPLTGAHERVPCEGCHRGGLFAGTPPACGQCHTKGGPFEAGGKPLQHVPTSDQCGDCHLTTSWSPAHFDHLAVSGRCVSCHNGGFATGKPVNHVPSSDDCELCHGTVAWEPARFDHSGVMGNCFACHNGTTATGKPAGHPLTSNECELCHDTRNWDAARFDHTGIVSDCARCHGVTATGKPSGHFVTNRDCSECHTPGGWLPARYPHTGAAYPGDHAGNPACQACHTGNSETVPWPFAAYAPDCAGCHAGDFRPGPHRKIESPETFYTAAELRDCTGACHTYADPTLTTIVRSRSGEHSVRSSGW